MESLSPNIFVDSMVDTVAFYKSLGFKLVMSVPEAGEDLIWAMMANGNVTMMFQTFASLGGDLPEISRNNGASQLLYIKMKKIREFFEQVKDKVKVLKPLETTFYGATEFSILDNNNYVLTFAEDE
jgi:uncharacterized glyoxalase superfamily protein PhnB